MNSSRPSVKNLLWAFFLLASVNGVDSHANNACGEVLSLLDIPVRGDSRLLIQSIENRLLGLERGGNFANLENLTAKGRFNLAMSIQQEVNVLEEKGAIEQVVRFQRRISELAIALYQEDHALMTIAQRQEQKSKLLMAHFFSNNAFVREERELEVYQLGKRELFFRAIDEKDPAKMEAALDKAIGEMKILEEELTKSVDKPIAERLENAFKRISDNCSIK